MGTKLLNKVDLGRFRSLGDAFAKPAHFCKPKECMVLNTNALGLSEAAQFQNA